MYLIKPGFVTLDLTFLNMRPDLSAENISDGVITPSGLNLHSVPFMAYWDKAGLAWADSSFCLIAFWNSTSHSLVS